MQQLRPFNANAVCPKCGAHEINTAYCAAAKPQSVGRHLVGREHLRRTCARCCYAWLESVAQPDLVPAGAARRAAPRHRAASGRQIFSSPAAATPRSTGAPPGYTDDNVIEAIIEEDPAAWPASLAAVAQPPSTQLARLERTPVFLSIVAPPAPGSMGGAPTPDAKSADDGEAIELTVPQLNAGIARALGWRYFGPCGFWIKPVGGTQREPPDYCANVQLAWQLLTQVRQLAGAVGVTRWTEYLDNQQTEWSHLSDTALALRLARAFHYARTGQQVLIVADDD